MSSWSGSCSKKHGFHCMEFGSITPIKDIIVTEISTKSSAQIGITGIEYERTSLGPWNSRSSLWSHCQRDCPGAKQSNLYATF